MLNFCYTKIGVNFIKKHLKYLLLLIPIGILLLTFYFSYATRDIIFVVVGILIFSSFLVFTKEGQGLDRRLFGKKSEDKVRKNKISFKRIKNSVKNTHINRHDLFILLLIFIFILILQTIIQERFIVKKLGIYWNFQKDSSSLVVYFKDVFYGIKHHWYVYLLIPLYFITNIVYLIIKTRKRLKVFFALTTSILSSLCLTFLLAFISGYVAVMVSNFEAGYRIGAIVYSFNSSGSLEDLGVLTKTSDIINEIKKERKNFKITSYNKEINRKLLYNYFKSQDVYSPFFTDIVVNDTVDNLDKTLSINENIFLLPNNTLVIREIDKKKIEDLSPTIGWVLVKNHFDKKYIKEFPNVKLMSKQEYIKYRDDKINEQINEIQGYIDQAVDIINTYYARISEAKDKIQANKDGLKEAKSYRDTAYDDCRDYGYYSYLTGDFYHYYSEEECRDQERQWDDLISGYEKNISDWEADLNNTQYLLNQAVDTKETLENYRSLVETRKDSAPFELGLFESPDSIKVVLENVDRDSIDDYAETLVHEYLHYSSYVDDERILDNVFEEGLTEFFAREVVYDELGIKTDIGYPHLVPIMKALSKSIDEEDLEEIYFTKDQDRLVTELNSEYGDNFYSESAYYFSILPYVSSAEDALDIVNNVLLRVGGKPIELNDIVSN